MKLTPYGLIIIAGGLLLLGSWYLLSDKQSHSSIISKTDEPTGEQRLSIVTSFYPLQYALEQIVGELGTVTNIGAGKDPHHYEPNVNDMVTLQKADLVVLQGADFEPWGDELITRLKADDVPVILATANLTLHNADHDHENEQADELETSHDNDEENKAEKTEHSGYDPHTWLDPVLFSQTVNYLTDEIITLDPENAITYRDNADQLMLKLSDLDIEYRTRLANCDYEEVITSHNAFGYVAERYDFSVHSIAGLSTQDTPSAKTLAELKEEAQEGIMAILLEQNNITAYGETLARETNLITLSINPIAYTIQSEEDYLTLMRANLDSFAIALNCNE